MSSINIHKKFFEIVMYAAAILLYLFFIIHFNKTTPVYQRYSSAAGAYVCYEKAQVINIKQESLQKDTASGLYLGFQLVTLKILSGEHKSEILLVRNTLNYTSNIKAKPGLHVITCIDTADKDHYNVWIYNYDRGPYLLFFAALFILTLCVVGGNRGIRSVLGIFFSISGIIFLFIPMLYRGYSPIWASIGVVIITAIITLTLIGGIRVKTLSALFGTVAGMIISGLFLIIALSLTHLSGYNTSDSDVLIQLGNVTHMKVSELLFAAILISSLGAVIDIAISISSSTYEIYINNRTLSVKDLFKSGMNVGRDMMGAMANTLIIAFTGTSLNLLILLRTLDIQYYQLLNTNLIDIYIIQAISGSIAVVLTVPLSSIISAQFLPLLSQNRIRMPFLSKTEKLEKVITETAFK